MAENRKSHNITELDIESIKQIAGKATELRKATGMTYEEFAIHAKINRNTYFKFEKSSATGNNFTIAVLAKVIRGLDLTFETFFEGIK